jgi:RimJ/RimL family protein N-acetyltransferase
VDAFYEMHGRPEVSRFLIWVPATREDAVVKLRKLARMRGITERNGALRLAVVLQATGLVIGDVNMEIISRRDQEAEVGWVFHPDHQGKGYATEAAAEMLRLGFEEMGLHRMMAVCDARNVPSARVMERLGMRREGHFRERENVRGEWWDTLYYGILASEWRAAH